MQKIKPLYLIAIVLITALATWKLTVMNRYQSVSITLLTVKRLDSCLNAANKILQESNKQLLYEFDQNLKRPEIAEKAALCSPIMHNAIDEAEKMYVQIETSKTTLKKEAGLATFESEERYQEDDIDAASRLMIKQAEGQKLMDSLKAFYINILAPLSKEQRAKIFMLPVSNLIHQTSDSYFKETPAVAAIAVLTKFQNNVLRSGNIVASFCQSQIGIDVIIMDDWFEALISQNTTNLLPGQTLEIKAGLGSFSSATKLIITIGGKQHGLAENGVAECKIKVGNTNGTIPVSISFKEPNTGATITKTSTVSYTVTKQ